MMDERIRDALKLTNPRPDRESRIAMVSLPVPLGMARPSGIGELPTQTQSLGWWSESIAGERDIVRRQLMFAISENELPDSLNISWDQRMPGSWSEMGRTYVVQCGEQQIHSSPVTGCTAEAIRAGLSNQRHSLLGSSVLSDTMMAP